ncbi:MAG TPA: hypothetical protein VMT03_16310 [Polyangia bacterium]|nr:hypothetical protein [Polyangia bacterium]
MKRLSRASAVICALLVLVGASAILATWLTRRFDVGAVRAALPPSSQGAFDLLLALHPPPGGDPDWGRAERICRDLWWPRCDRPALDVMRKHSASPIGTRRDAVPTSAAATADLIWGFGSEDAARKMFRTELDRLPESDGPGRARVFLRFGIIDTNPDGQAALFNQACAADAQICDHMKEAALREVHARFMPPGNVLPLYFGNGRGHPAIPGKP